MPHVIRHACAECPASAGVRDVNTFLAVVVNIVIPVINVTWSLIMMNHYGRMLPMIIVIMIDGSRLPVIVTISIVVPLTMASVTIVVIISIMIVVTIVISVAISVIVISIAIISSTSSLCIHIR